MSKVSPFAHAAAAALLHSRYRQKGDAATANTNQPARSAQYVVAQPAGRMRALGSLCAILPHLQQENSPYSICTGQISQAAQFIRANYRCKALEVISTRRSQTYTDGVLPSGRCVKQRPHSLASQETGWSDCDTGQCGSGPVLRLQSHRCFSQR